MHTIRISFPYEENGVDRIGSVLEGLEQAGFVPLGDDEWENGRCAREVVFFRADDGEAGEAREVAGRIASEVFGEGVAEVEDIRHSDDNVDRWFGGDADHEVVAALCALSSDWLESDDWEIDRHIRDHYVGHFDSERDLAAMLADGDPRIQVLDERIVRALDLVKLYDDEIRFGFSHENGHYFSL